MLKVQLNFEIINAIVFSSNIDDIIEYWRKESYLSNLDHGEDIGTPGKLWNGCMVGKKLCTLSNSTRDDEGIHNCQAYFLAFGSNLAKVDPIHTYMHWVVTKSSSLFLKFLS